MSKTPNYYEVLGVPENAGLATIKRRYRELVRVYHPDVAGNKAEAHKMFIRISEAYEALSDTDARAAYDTTLKSERDKERKKREDAAEQRRRRYQRVEHSGIGITPEQKKQALQYVRNAQLAFIQRRLQTASTLCKDAIALDPRNAQAHAILGDIYKIRGKTEQAINHYSFAVQFNPSDKDIDRKLNELLSVQMPGPQEDENYGPGTSGFYLARMNLAAWAMVVGLFISIKLLPSQTYIGQGETVYAVPIWNWWMLPMLGLIGLIIGMIFAINGWVGSPSRDLFSTGRLVKGGDIPLGHVVLAVSLLSFWVTAGIYFAVALLRADVSRSVLRLLGAAIGTLFVSSILYGNVHSRSIMIWCGNAVFPCSILGWYCGYAFNPMKRYGWYK